MARHVLNIAVTEVDLDRTGVVSVSGELVAAGMVAACGHVPDAQTGRQREIPRRIKSPLSAIPVRSMG
jgi:hypothetical protein